MIRVKEEKEEKGEELLPCDDSANEGVYTTVPQSLRSNLFPLNLATTKDFIHFQTASS